MVVTVQKVDHNDLESALMTFVRSRTGEAWLRDEPLTFDLPKGTPLEVADQLVKRLRKEGFPDPRCVYDVPERSLEHLVIMAPGDPAVQAN